MVIDYRGGVGIPMLGHMSVGAASNGAYSRPPDGDESRRLDVVFQSPMSFQLMRSQFRASSGAVDLISRRFVAGRQANDRVLLLMLRRI